MIKRVAAPYAGTRVDPEKSKSQISRLLQKYGVDGIQWSEIFAKNRVELSFVLQQEGHRPIMVRLQPPPFATNRKSWIPEKGRYKIIDSSNWAQSYRLLYAYLKAKLESIAFGLRDVEEEFLADVIVRDTQGRERKVLDVVADQLEAGALVPALGPGEPDEEKSKPRTVIEVNP